MSSKIGQQLTEIQSEILPLFEGRETEENWESRERALNRLKLIFSSQAAPEEPKGSESETKSFFSRLQENDRAMHQWQQESIMKHLTDAVFAQSALSLRSALISASCQCMSVMFKLPQARQFLDPVSDKFMVCLLKLCSQSKKVVVQLGSVCIVDLLQVCSYNVKLLERLCNGMTEKSVGLREKSVEFILALVQLQQTSSAAFLKSGGLDLLDRMLAKALSDASSSVRSISRQILSFYQQQWSERAQLLIDGLDPSTKKILSRSSATIGSSTSVSSASKGTGLKKKLASSSLSSLKAKKAAGLAVCKNEDISVTIFAPPPNTSDTVKHNPPLKPNVEVIRKSVTPVKHVPEPPSSEFQTPAKEIVLPGKNRNFGMVGIPSQKHSSTISLTPLMQQQHKKLSQMSLEDSPMPQSKHNPSQPAISSSLVPSSVSDRQKMLKLAVSMRDSTLNEKHFRRICRFSKAYGQPRQDSSQEELELCQLWHSEFPSILQILVNIITLIHSDEASQISSRDVVCTHIENSLICLKYALQFHPRLFSGYEHSTVHALMLVLAETEDSIYNGTASELSTVAMDVFRESVREFPFDVVAQVLVDELKASDGAQHQQLYSKGSTEFEYSMKGVCFRLLGTLASVYSSASSMNGEMHPVEQHLVVPVFEAGLVHSNITCSRVMTRMAVYEYLISVWKVLGNVFVKQYLVPIAAQANITAAQSQNRSCLMKGLSLPCYKLFLALCDQDKQKIMTSS